MIPYPDKPNTAVPEDAAIAAALGVGGLRTGRHYLRDESGGRVGCLWLDTLWTLQVMPSFHDHGLVGVAVARGEKFRGVVSPGWIKGVLAADDVLAVRELDADPLPDLLGKLPLLAKSTSMSIDGVGYRLRVETLAIDADLSFSNPSVQALAAVERACWALADTMACASGENALTTFTASWRGYLSRGPSSTIE
jgi:hypothetical protein